MWLFKQKRVCEENAVQTLQPNLECCKAGLVCKAVFLPQTWVKAIKSNSSEAFGIILQVLRNAIPSESVAESGWRCECKQFFPIDKNWGFRFKGIYQHFGKYVENASFQDLFCVIDNLTRTCSSCYFNMYKEMPLKARALTCKLHLPQFHKERDVWCRHSAHFK